MGSEKIYNWAMPKIHNDTSNAAFFDGHVENLTFREFLTREWGDR
jgi:prepilin-type processing-associated H-X9-DG protein